MSLMLSMSTAQPAAIPVARNLSLESSITDPFYHPPDGFEHEELATILKHCSIVASIFGIISNPVEAHQ
jgi:hypothetical protein